MMCDFKRSTEKVGLKIHPEKTKILSNQSSNRRREVAINNIKVKVLPVNKCAMYLGQTESNSNCLGVVVQVQTGVDIKIVPPASTDFACSMW